MSQGGDHETLGSPSEHGGGFRTWEEHPMWVRGASHDREDPM